MAGEKNTAEKQNEIRREMKRKQKVGRRRRRPTETNNTVRLSRWVKGEFSPETKTLLSSMIMEEKKIVTGRILIRLMHEGKLSVIVHDEDNVLINGKTFFVTTSGFKDLDGDVPGYEFYGVTVEIAQGFGYQFKWDKSKRMFVN